jgi:hypothetical protein
MEEQSWGFVVLLWERKEHVSCDIPVMSGGKKAIPALSDPWQ